MGSTEKPNAFELIRGWRSSLAARRILIEGGLLLALVVCSSWLIRR
jgi:hypothetical protein